MQTRELGLPYGPTARLKCIMCNKVSIPRKVEDFYKFSYEHLDHIECLRIELI